MEIFSTPLVFLTIFLTPLLALVTLIVALAALGASLGLRKMYVKALLKVFEVSLPSATRPRRLSNLLIIYLTQILVRNQYQARKNKGM